MKFSKLLDYIDTAIDYAAEDGPDFLDKIAAGLGELQKVIKDGSNYLRSFRAKAVEEVDLARVETLKAKIEALQVGTSAIGDGQLRKRMLDLALALLERFLKPS